MRSYVHGVTVTLATGRALEYSWASALKVTRRKELFIYHRRRARVRLHADEWLAFRAVNTPAVLDSPATHLRVVEDPADTITNMPRLSLDRGFEPVPRRG